MNRRIEELTSRETIAPWLKFQTFWFVLRQNVLASERFEKLLTDEISQLFREGLGELDEPNSGSADSNALYREVAIRITSLTINCLSFAFAS